MVKSVKIVSKDYATQLQSMMGKDKSPVKKKVTVGYSYKSFKNLTPTPINVFNTGKATKIPAIVHVENSLAAADKLAKSKYMDYFLTTQKDSQHFRSAAKYLKMQVVTRQCVKNTDKVWVYRTK